MLTPIPRTPFFHFIAVPLIALILVVLVAAAPCFADTLTRTSGQTLTGRVISEEKDVVVFEANLGGMVMRQRIPRTQIKSLSKQVREGPPYIAIPLFGEVGVEITADGLTRALTEAKRHNPQYVVLVIDSVGGLVSEKEKICEVIRRHARDLRFIAYVKQAVSAAAIIALACPDIYVAEESTIGATVTVMPGAFGALKVADEKIQSVVRATDRAVALGAGHSDLWVRGMGEKDLELAAIVSKDRPPRIVEATGEPDQQVIKRRGQILTLTSSEAVEYGLAKGACPNVESLKDALGLSAWHAADERPWHMMLSAGQAARARREHATRVGPEVRTLQARLTDAAATLAVAEATLKQIRKLHDEELKRLDEEYQQRSTQVRGPASAKKLDRSYQDAKSKLDEHYGAQIARCEEEARKAGAEQRRIADELESLIGRAD